MMGRVASSNESTGAQVSVVVAVVVVAVAIAGTTRLTAAIVC